VLIFPAVLLWPTSIVIVFAPNLKVWLFVFIENIEIMTLATLYQFTWEKFNEV